MATSKATKNILLPITIAYVCCCVCVSGLITKSDRLDLHSASNGFVFDYKSRTFLVDSSPWEENANVQEETLLHSRHRQRRSPTTTTKAPASAHTPDSYYTQLNDSHSQMIVHWAGEGSKVIIALARDSRPNNNSNSNLFISRNYGRSFDNVKVNMPTGEVPIIDHYHNSHAYNSRYVFTDIIHDYIFTTTNYGNTFAAHSVPFKPTTLKLHETSSNMILGMDKNDTQKKLYLSVNFGESWRVIQSGVKSFSWGVAPYDNATVIFVERVANGRGSILKSSDFFRHEITLLINNVDDFQIEGAYMFATKVQRLFGANQPSTQQLWVSYKRSSFVNAEFSHPAPRYDYYIVDASEDQVFVVVTHNQNNWQSHLYISDASGTKYSLSLENITYFNPKGAHNDTWLKYFAQESFADVTKIMGLKGVYIASQLKNLSVFNVENQHSLITFDKGGEWSPVLAPATDMNNRPTNCSGILLTTNCSLHLTQEFSRLYPGGRTVPILSRDSAPGLVLATGAVGASLKRNPDIYLSSDAGYSWNMVLQGNFFYAFGDHGGVIVAVPQFRATNSLYYSWNEGETWELYNFHTDKIRVYGVLTEPGETTAVFSLFGSHLIRHRWMIVQVNMTKIFPYKCSDDDYKKWSFNDEKPYAGCILGRKLLIERRIAHAKCYNGLEYEREITEKNCSCIRQDYECDYGFKLDDQGFNLMSEKCVTDEKSGFDIHAVPSYCPIGTFYPYTRGYRKVSGDTCEGGQAFRYDPLMYSCPVNEMPEFILYSTRNSIHRIILDSSLTDDVLYSDSSSSRIHAVEFDYRNNCVFFSDNVETAEIKKLCFGDNETLLTVISTHLKTVESIQYDWSSNVLYWLDSGERKIEVAKTDGRYRKLLFNSTVLEKPRSLTLDPHYGHMYWTDWAAVNPRIMRASMDGSVKSLTMIVNGSSHVHWPNGIAIDHQQSKIFWTDAYLDKIFSAELNGGNITVILHGSYYLSRPYSIGVFKNSLYWTDLQKKAILSADKTTGAGFRTIKSSINNVMDLKILSRTSQSSTTACSTTGNAGCRQLCLPHSPHSNPSSQNRTCVCGDGYSRFKTGPSNDEHCQCDSRDEVQNGVCTPVTGSNCSSEHFTCSNGRCIPDTWICDRDNDCHDGSDELDCPFVNCRPGYFKCSNSRCIPSRWQCDFDNDCTDGSDELNCVRQNCSASQFQCGNGRCIPKNWTCDHDNDCHDNTDEINCNWNATCGALQFPCVKNKTKCISALQICDGNNDCPDRSDEVNCTSCPSYKFRCASGQCVYRNWVCDGDDDCIDGSDEHNCTSTSITTTGPVQTTASHGCRLWQFSCHNRECVYLSEVCDGISDCTDGSDEFNCPSTSTSKTTTSGTTGCNENEFLCSLDNTCIPDNWVCDNQTDCRSGDDEKNCHGINVCAQGYFTCATVEGCVPKNRVCDHVNDCLDKSDERGCYYDNVTTTAPKTECSDHSFYCNWFGRCVLRLYTCHWSNPCYVLMDFPECHERANVTNLEATVVTSNSVSLTWKAPTESYGPYKYIVSYLQKADESTWHNSTVIDTTKYVLKHLRPETQYIISVYAWSDKKHKAFPPVSPLLVLTEDGVPMAPTHFTVNAKVNDTSHVVLAWQPPVNPFGVIIGYIIHQENTDRKVVTVIRVRANIQSYILGPENLKYGKKYIFWVTAYNHIGEGNETARLTFVYDSNAVANSITGLVPKIEEFSIKLTWNAPVNSPKLDGYKIKYTDAWDAQLTNTTKETSYTLNNLCPGHFYRVSIIPYNDHGDGPSTHGFYQTKGAPIGNPTNLALNSQSNTAFLVSWNHPQNLMKTSHWNYTVYYDKEYKDMDDEKNIEQKALKVVVPDATQVVLKGLEACESYTVRVALTSPGKCALSSSIDLMTAEDNKGQPKNLQLHWDPKDYTKVNLTWEAPCSHQLVGLGYMVELKEVNTTKQWKKQPYTNTGKIHLLYELSPLTRGASYTAMVRTHITNSRWSEIIHINTPPYGAPENIRIDELGNMQILLIWNAPANKDFPKTFNGYEVYQKINSDDGKSQRGSYKLYKTVHSKFVTCQLEKGKEYWYMVRLAKVDGYPGAWSQDKHILSSEVEMGPIAGANAQPPDFVSMSNTNMIAIIVSITAIVITLVVVLAFFIVRHRRLQRSFLAFANSHYDTRSGTTTFSAADEIGEEEDSPMIRGFSDDEPLVIA